MPVEGAELEHTDARLNPLKHGVKSFSPLKKDVAHPLRTPTKGSMQAPPLGPTGVNCDAKRRKRGMGEEGSEEQGRGRKGVQDAKRQDEMERGENER